MIVVTQNERPSCSQHVKYTPFLVNSELTNGVRLLPLSVRRTNDMDVFTFLSDHIRKESAAWRANVPRLIRTVPSDNLLQIRGNEASVTSSLFEEGSDETTENQI